MRNQGHAYKLTGLALISSGIILSTLAFFMLTSIPLTALGLSTIILGSVMLAVSATLPRIPAEASRLMLESGIRNASALIEELGLRSKAIYLPSRLTGGKPLALIPLASNPETPRIAKPISKRLIVQFGLDPENIGLLMETPGTLAAEMFEKPSEKSAGALETAISTLLVNVLGVVDSVRISIEDERLAVELLNPKVDFEEEAMALKVLGSPLASTVASLIAESLDKPVIVDSEENTGKALLIRLQVVG